MILNVASVVGRENAAEPSKTRRLSKPVEI